ncbi:MAG: glycosyltransferase family 4 protein, partial [Kiritimatiellaceae bacterium]|nr:glycosyltransferase family 4 protein [Kiritimatiellaceae bacterium]
MCIKRSWAEPVLKVVQILLDDRDVLGRYEQETPFFGSAPTALLEGFAQLGSQIEIHVITCTRKNMPAPAKLAENIFYHQVIIPGGYRRTLFIKAIRDVQKVIRQINPDVVHGQGTEDYPALCAAFSGYPNCTTIHGNMRQVARRLGYRPFFPMVMTACAEWIALRKTNAVVCNSHYTAQCVGKLNPCKPQIFNAVRSSFFNEAVRLEDVNAPHTVNATKTLLCIGHILPYKNQIALIHALDTIPDIDLLFAGRCNPAEPYGQAFLKEISNRSWCTHLGEIKLRDLQHRLKQSHGVIHPTLEDSFGLAVAEAQGLGVPVAASAIGGLPDLITHGVTGLLFNPH